MRHRPRPASSGAASFFLAGVGVLLLLIAHFSIRTVIGGPAPIDFIAIAVLFLAVGVRPGVAAIIGFVAGVIVDSLTPTSFGAATLAFTFVAYAASWLRAIFFAEHVALTGVFIFLGKWTFDAIYMVVGREIRGSELVVQLLLWSTLASAFTALLAILLLTLFRPIFRPRSS